MKKITLIKNPAFFNYEIIENLDDLKNKTITFKPLFEGIMTFIKILQDEITIMSDKDIIENKIKHILYPFLDEKEKIILEGIIKYEKGSGVLYIINRYPNENDWGEKNMQDQSYISCLIKKYDSPYIKLLPSGWQGEKEEDYIKNTLSLGGRGLILHAHDKKNTFEGGVYSAIWEPKNSIKNGLIVGKTFYDESLIIKYKCPKKENYFILQMPEQLKQITNYDLYKIIVEKIEIEILCQSIDEEGIPKYPFISPQSLEKIKKLISY